MNARLRDRSLLRRLLGFARPYRIALGFGLLLLLLQVVCTNLLPFMIKTATDRYLAPGTADPGLAARLEGLNGVIAWMAALAAGMFLFRISQTYLMTWVGQHVLRDLRLAVYRKVLALPMRRVDQLRVGRLMTRATSDLDALQELVRNGLIGMLANVLLVFGAAGFMWKLEWRLALTLFAVIPLLVGLLVFVNRHSRRAQRGVRDAVSKLNSQTQETLSGMFTLRVFSRRTAMRERLSGLSDAVRTARVRVADWNTWHFPILELTRALANAGLILTVAVWLRDEPGSLVSFLFFIRYFFRPLEELAEQSSQLQSGLASAERVFALLAEEEVTPDPDDPVVLEHVRGEIRFDGVTFGYDPEHPVLHDLNLHIRPGSFVAVVGATGAGKSTLFNLLCRFYDPQAGSISLDGVDLREFARENLRRHLGMVQQDPMLFSGTVADNIGLGRPGADREAVERAARRVNAHGFIEKLENGYETDLGEGGYRLSTGQKQLIALARILLQDPEVMLMLDEATSSVDSETERLIQEGLEEVRGGRTCIAIAHRLSTIQHADHILVLKHGRLLEQGTHPELLAADGYYRDLVEAMRIGVEV